jgi:alpha-L-fucosidase
LLLLLSGPRASGQGGIGDGVPRNVVVIPPGSTPEEIVRRAAQVVPSPRQLAWQELEFVAFIHFGMNTFTDREWGDGTESPALFNPARLDARQWAGVIKEAGMKMVIVTAKHHDGFCLWPSKFTEHSVRNSPWRGGKGDVVGDVAAACREAGLKFGFYLSPWDRHEPGYGDSPRYNEHFLNQLRELLTNYGEVSEVWFDGANGEGPNGKRQVYDWPSYYRLIRELQPNAVIAVMGPDVRWVGTESGYGRESEWSVVPDVARSPDAIAAGSQKDPVDDAFVPGDLTADDLGGRERLASAHALVWYPSEADVSIRPGWFYHADQDHRVKTPGKLVDIYYNSVGKNSVLLLNLPPDKRGLIHGNDVKNLMGMRKILDRTFASDLSAGAAVKASSEHPDCPARLAFDGDQGTYWTTEEGISAAVLEIDLPSNRTIDRALLQEYIRAGQRVERFHLDVWNGTEWEEVAGGTTIGYKRLLRFPAVAAARLRLVIEDSRGSPTLSTFRLFKAPPRVVIEPESGGFQDSLVVHLSSDVPGVHIHHTLDGTSPTLHSPIITKPIVLTRTTTVRAVAVVDGEPGIEEAEGRFTKCRQIEQILLSAPASGKYPGRGGATLTDGVRGSADFQDGKWLGFEGEGVTATLDLGKTSPVRSISAGFLQQQGSWIFLPSRISIAVSVDGRTWRSLHAREVPLRRSEEVVVKDLAHRTGGITARYVRITARNVGRCPPWHPGAGEKAWLFVDEIIIE